MVERPSLKRLVPIRHRDWLRSALRGNPYRYEAAAGPVRIGEIVSPLRYDVLLRAAHFAFHAEHRERFAQDFDGYAALARETGYFTWFAKVMVPAWLPHLAGDAAGLDTAWRERLRGSAALHASFERGGFDERHPIELHAGVRVAPAPTGKRAARALFAGDGNHRLSLLLAAGRDVLEPSEYRVKRYRSLVPADTTGFLLEETCAGWSQYASFIALGYPAARVGRTPGGVSVDHPDPVVAAELRAVVAVDMPYLKAALT